MPCFWIGNFPNTYRCLGSKCHKSTTYVWPHTWRNMGIDPSCATLSSGGKTQYVYKSFRINNVRFKQRNQPIHHFLLSTLYAMCFSFLIHSHWHQSPLSTHYSFSRLLSTLFFSLFLFSFFVFLIYFPPCFRHSATFSFTHHCLTCNGISLLSYNNA